MIWSQRNYNRSWTLEKCYHLLRVLSLDITEMRNRLWCATTHSLIKLFTVERWGHDIDKVGSFSILFSGQQQSLGPIKDAVWDHVLYFYWYVLLHYPSASKLHATCIIVAVGSSQTILPKQNLEGTYEGTIFILRKDISMTALLMHTVTILLKVR